ncbi:TlpA family protein disulfide reductase [Devosia sp. RR2S18]|uniref:TlpA family protein disulfide reductase n=1 Tax=Devosia rhizosphaerae TaxID=3049774 RepID=UPI002541B03F|nr:redoxin domain-containing protein [Devosia sp. RR2S18]WIJ25091.1 redoxin domain-containing protein [Devosia sp. RR2S18]
MAQATLVANKNYSSDERYQYDTFTTGLILHDMVFKRSDPGPGDMVPAFDLPVVGGERFQSSDLGAKPVLMVFGSLTCPVTESSGPVLNRLHMEFGDQIRFVVVNTREAHPGELIPQPKTLREKEEHAEQLRQHHRFAFEVAIDDIEGTFHRAMGPKPNSAYLLTPQGQLLFRAHWANDARSLKSAITQVLAGRGMRKGKSSAMLWPLLKAIGHLPAVVQRGGRKVARDVWRAVPPFGVMGGASRLLPFLPRDYRGPAVTIMLVGSVAGATIFLLL